MWKRLIPAFLFPALLILLPILLRQETQQNSPEEHTDILVAVSPHTEPIKYEFERAFRKYYKEQTGRDIRIDWRSLGGTNDITRYVEDRFTAEFRLAWLEKGNEYNNTVEKAFKDPKSESAARKFFLDSQLGIGVDIFFGGGSYEHNNFAKKGFAVDSGTLQRHPEYFTDIPADFAGETIYDKQGRWFGCCLSSFGLAINPDRFREADLPIPESWQDLTKPELFQKIAVADPTKSGSVTKCYEMILQQAMAEYAPDLERGWQEGFRRIKLIAANSRYVTDSAGKLVRDVSSGAVMAGICIDFYGFSEAEWTKKTTGAERLIYKMPRNGSAVTCDPVQMLRGAPNRKAAELFVDFCVSPAGQKLWLQKVGTEGGPEKFALLRTSVKKDLTRTIPRSDLSYPDYDPYAMAGTFSYKGAWTGRYFSLIRILIKCIALDPMDDLRTARESMIRNNAETEAMPLIAAMPFTYEQAAQMAKKLSSGTAAEQAKLRREWTAFAVTQYRNAAKAAEEKKQ